MIIVHDIFICKPGNASKLAKKFKEGMADMSELVHVMTDAVGQFNKVVIVTQYENLTAYELSFQKYMQHSEETKKMEEAMAGYQDMYFTGSREIYQVSKWKGQSIKPKWLIDFSPQTRCADKYFMAVMQPFNGSDAALTKGHISWKKSLIIFLYHFEFLKPPIIFKRGFILTQL